MLHEDGGRESGDQVMHEVWVILKELRSLVLHCCLQGLCIRRGNTVPCLRLSPGEREREGEGRRREKGEEGEEGEGEEGEEGEEGRRGRRGRRERRERRGEEGEEGGGGGGRRKEKRGRREGREEGKEGETLNIILCNINSFFLPSPVQVVDGVAPVVLNVPAETGETHAHIQPWNLWGQHTT